MRHLNQETETKTNLDNKFIKVTLYKTDTSTLKQTCKHFKDKYERLNLLNLIT
jgi:hypothetical protein